MDMVGEKIGEVTEPALEAMGRAGETIKETGKSVGGTLWRNPIPIALIGLGVGMLVMRARSGNGHDYSGSYRTSGVDTDRLTRQPQYGMKRGALNSGALNQVKETASDLAHRSTDALGNITTAAKDRASALGNGFTRIMRENPLVIGAVAVAAGTAVGLALPTTSFEDEYLGETSGMLVDKAQEVARGALDKVQDAAQQAVGQD